MSVPVRETRSPSREPFRERNSTADHGWLSRERALALILVTATAIVVYLCYRLTLPFLPALAWALALAVVVDPLHRWVCHWMPGRNLAASLSVVLVALVVIVPVVFVTSHLIREADNGLKLIERQLESGAWRSRIEQYPRLKPVANWIETQFGFASWDPTIAKQQDQSVPPHTVPANDPPDSKRARIPDAAAMVAQGVGSILANGAWIGMQLFITLLALFFFFRDRHRVLQAIRSLMPLSEKETDEVFSRVSETIHATIYGSLVVALVQGTMGGLMFWWLGLPSPLFWGAVMSLLAIVPVLGTFVVWAPTAIFLALQGEIGKALILAAWGGIAIALIDNALTPFLVGKRMQFHTLLVFIAIIGGLAMFGASGVILGPLLLAIADALLDVWKRRTAFGGTIEAGIEKNA